jgi:hypothetical protein
MSEGGFLIKFDGKEAKRCYKVTFDYDGEEYTVNDSETKPLPKSVKTAPE